MIKFLKRLFVKEKNLITPPKGSLERILGYKPDFTKAPNGVVEQILSHRQDLDKNRNSGWLPKEMGHISKITHWLKTEKPDLSQINEKHKNGVFNDTPQQDIDDAIQGIKSFNNGELNV